MNTSPVGWLMSGGRGLRVSIWIFVAVLLLPVFFAAAWQRAEAVQIAVTMCVVLIVSLKVFVAIRASQFFVEARRNGAIELILCTPLSGSQVLAGQWRAMRELMLWPVAVFSMGVLGSFAALEMAGQSGGESMFLFVMASFFIGPKFLIEIMAVGWFGMWMGLKCKKPSLASLWTILFAVVLPTPLVFFCCGDFIVSFVLLLVARSNLEKNFRFILTGDRPVRYQYGEIRPYQS
jgi:hypothetical protein